MSQVPERTTREKRYSVGVFSRMFGFDPGHETEPGIARTSVTMIGGRFGAGKTTLFLQFSDMILDAEPEPRRAIFFAFEQSDEELRDTGKRLRLRHMDRVVIYNALSTGLRRPLAHIIEEVKPCFMVFDSLTRCIGRDYDLAEPLVANMKELSVQYRYPTMVVNQLNKDMEHAGKMEVPHAVDVVMGLDLDERTEKRLWFSQKNRFGKSPMEMTLRMMAEDSERPGYLVTEQEFEESERGRINPHRRQADPDFEEEGHEDEEEGHDDEENMF